jgi:hypothetical protein
MSVAGDELAEISAEVVTDEGHLVQSLSPGTAEAHQMRPIDPAVAEVGAAERGERVEPGPESARPLAGPAELAGRMTRGDRAAVEHARRTWRRVAFHHREHRLVEATQASLRLPALINARPHTVVAKATRSVSPCRDAASAARAKSWAAWW